MHFRLLYNGPLKAGGKDQKHIHEIRKYLQPQLENLWKFPPLNMPGTDKVTSAKIGHDDSPQDIKIAGRLYRPIVQSKINLLAELDILFLRPEPPGKMFNTTGDLDNRIKTLFDALKPPDPNQAIKLDTTEDPTLFHVLLEDDALISGLHITTDRLLPAPHQTLSGGTVHLVVTVTITATHAHMDNLHMLGP